METKGRTNLIRGAAILSLAGIVCKVLGVLIRSWASAVIGVDGMEYYEIVFPFYSWLLILSSSGIPTAISRMVAERVSLGDHAGARSVFRRALLILTLLGLASTAVLFFGADFFAVQFLGKGQELSLSFKALAPALFFVSVLCAYRGYLQGLQLMTGTSVSQIAEQVFKCAIGLLLASRWISRGPAWGAAGLLVGVSVSELAALIIMLLFTLKNRRVLMPLGAPKEAVYNKRILSTLFKIAIPITIGASVLPLTSMLDVKMIYYFLEKYLSAEDARYCYVALSTYVRSLINLPASLTTALAISIVPSLSAARAKQDLKSVNELSRLNVKLAMVVGLPCAAGLFVLGGPIIQMLFPSIEQRSLEIAVPLMRIASISVIFISLTQAVTGALQGVGKQRLPVYFLAIGAALKVLCNVLLLSIPSINIKGASISNIVCYGVAGILDTIALVRAVKLKLHPVGTFLKPLIASVLMGAVVYFVYKLLYAWHPGTMVTLLAVLVGVIVYAALLFALRIFDAEELIYVPGGTRLKRFVRAQKKSAEEPPAPKE